MSANSPTYTCKGGGTPLVDTSSPYCIVPGGHRRMEVCCEQSGGNDVNFEEDCYSWCNVDVDRDLNHAANAFLRCLSQGLNSSVPVGMVCVQGTNDDDDSDNGSEGASVTVAVPNEADSSTASPTTGTSAATPTGNSSSGRAGGTKDVIKTAFAVSVALSMFRVH